MPTLFWVEMVTYSVAVVSALTLGLMVLATAPTRILNRLFALFTTLEAVWAVSAVLLRYVLMLDMGNAAFWLELAAFALNAMGFILPMFAARYVGRRTKYADILSGLALVILGFIMVPLFQDKLLLSPRLEANGIVTYDVTSWGYVVPLMPIPYFIWAFVLLWRDRREARSTYLALSVLVLLVGFLIGGMLRPFFPAPILSVTVTISVVILGYNIVSRQLFNPLRELTEQLEQRVEERTQELEASRDALAAQTDELERRARYLKATADVAREASSLLELEDLLPQIVAIIADRLELFRIGIFLLDTSKEWAVLRAVSGQGEGIEELTQELRIRVDGDGIVAHVIRAGTSHLAQDVSQELLYLHIDAVDDTRSELTVPLQARGETLGAMFAQSPKPQAFGEEDAAVMQLLADQVALTISNAQLFHQAQESLESERRAYGELSREAWRELLQAQPDLGFLSDRWATRPVEDVWRPEMRDALRIGDVVVGEEGNTLAIPIRVRDQVVGVIDGRKPGGTAWSSEEIDVLTAMTEQLNTALESARLYEETRQRMARERLVGDISAQMRSSTNLENMLRTAVQELGQRLSLDEVVFELMTEPSGQLNDE